MKNCAVYRNLFITALLTVAPVVAGADWAVVTHNTTNGTGTTRVAHITNKDGYSLEIYRDANNVIRSHLGMNAYNRLDGKTCPTFQVDKRPAQNRSINDAPCLAQAQWAEYIMGYITDDHVTSTAMNNLLNGNTISYRFILRDSGYTETSFSLAGSKRILMEVLGNNLVVSTEKDLP
jgi:hypothetical protein